jgi:hypothetical protein
MGRIINQFKKQFFKKWFPMHFRQNLPTVHQKCQAARQRIGTGTGLFLSGSTRALYAGAIFMESTIILCVFFQVGELFVLSILNDYFLMPNNIICICIYYIYNLHLNGCVSPIYWWLVQSTVSAWIMIIHQWKSSVMSHVAIATPPNHTQVRRCLVTSLWFT